MQTGKDEPDTTRSEDVETGAAGTPALQKSFRRLVSVARIQIHELNQTIEAFVLVGLKNRNDLDWTGLDTELLVEGHKVRRMRNGSFLIVLAVVAYLLIAVQRGDISALDYIMTAIGGLAVAWISWRMALRSARRLAWSVQQIATEGAIEDAEHPRVLFGGWIPKAHRSFYDRIRSLLKRRRK